MKLKEDKIRKIIREEIHNFIVENGHKMPFGGDHLTKQVANQPHGEKINTQKKSSGPFLDLPKKKLVQILDEFMEFRRVNNKKIDDFPNFEAYLAEENIPHYSIEFKDEGKPHPLNFEIFLAENSSGDIFCMVYEGGTTYEELMQNKSKNSIYDQKIKGVNSKDGKINISKIAEVMFRSILYVIGY